MTKHGYHSNPPADLDEDRARNLLGSRFPLWRNCKAVAEHSDVPFNYVWRAAVQIIDEGEPPRDSAVVARAKQLRADDRASIRSIEQRRKARNERRQRESQADENG
jgi:hypothetical protein